MKRRGKFLGMSACVLQHTDSRDLPALPLFHRLETAVVKPGLANFSLGFPCVPLWSFCYLEPSHVVLEMSPAWCNAPPRRMQISYSVLRRMRIDAGGIL